MAPAGPGGASGGSKNVIFLLSCRERHASIPGLGTDARASVVTVARRPSGMDRPDPSRGGHRTTRKVVIQVMLRVKSQGNESIDQLLRRFKKLCEKEGLTKHIKRNSYYEKPSERRRRKRRKALKRTQQEAR